MPTLLIAAERDLQSIDMSLKALSELTSDTTLDIVREARERGLSHTLEAIPGVANVFENAQSLQKVGQLRNPLVHTFPLSLMRSLHYLSLFLTPALYILTSPFEHLLAGKPHNKAEDALA